MKKFLIGASQVIGPKKVMEDQYVIKERYVGTDSFLAAIFDGHAGGQAAKLAAKILPNELKKRVEKGSPANLIEDLLSETFQTTSTQVRRQTESGTTATILLILEGDAYLANVGDSSAFALGKNGKWTFLTKDHNTSDPREVKKLMEKGGLVRGGYLWSKLGRGINLSRSLGDREFADWITDEPDVSHFKLEEEFANIVLASDGLWNFLDGDKVGKALKNETNSQKSANILVEFAQNEMKTQGWGDNVTVLVLTFP